MKKQNQWTLTWTLIDKHYKAKQVVMQCKNKQIAIFEYMSRLPAINPDFREISELKIWKNDVDYTATLNKFLAR